jgi:hypothetical protein
MAKLDPDFGDLGKNVELKLKGTGENVGEGPITYAAGGKVQVKAADGTYHQWSTHDVEVHEENG